MTSHSKPGWRRLTSKTHGTFETIPSLRVPGKEPPSGSSTTRKAMSPKKPAQYADPALFPGRRLDRRQPSSYSGVSGHSGFSGIDQLTLASSARFRAAGPGSLAGSTTKLSHTSLPSVNVTRPLPSSLGGGGDRGDGGSSDPWGSARQAREDSPLTMLRKQVAESTEEFKLSSILPHQSSISKVSRWQHSNFLLPTQRNRPVSLQTRETLLESPDSLESHDSELQPPIDHELFHQQQLRRYEQQEREKSMMLQQQSLKPASRGRYTPPPLKPDPVFPSQQPRGVRHVNPHRRPAHTPAVSPTPSGSGPMLNKILWALVPDEHANNSEAGISQKQPSCMETSATGDNGGHFVTVTDLDVPSEDSRQVPDTPRNPRLTEQTLSGHASASWSRDDRIFQWLAECDKETTSQSLPTHLPDIKYTFKFLKSAT